MAHGQPPQNQQFNITPQIEQALENYFGGDEFKGKLDGMLTHARVELVTRSERTARNWALAACVVIFVLFAFFAYRDYMDVQGKLMDIKGTQADIRIKYAEALELIDKIQDTLTALQTDVQTSTRDVANIQKETQALQKNAGDLKQQMQSFEQRAQDLGLQLGRARDGSSSDEPPE